MSNQPEDSFLRQNFKYYQEWHHWLGKAEKLKRAALILYNADLPDLRLYDHAYKRALEEIGEEGKAPVRHPHPDMLPAFSMFGSALENLLKGSWSTTTLVLLGPTSSPKACKSLEQYAVARAPSGGPGDRPSEQHLQIDRVLSIQIPHGVELGAGLGHSITGPLDK